MTLTLKVLSVKFSLTTLATYILRLRDTCSLQKSSIDPHIRSLQRFLGRERSSEVWERFQS